MEQDQSRKKSGILGDQSRKEYMNPPNIWKRKFEEDDAPYPDDRAYELRENPKKSWRLTIVHRSFGSGSDVQERSFKCEKELESDSAKTSQSFHCQFCKSKFNSVRGLNGHMRIHSARSSITVTPSLTPPSTSEPEILTKKKRSKRVKRSGSHYSSQFSEEEIELAEILLTLSASVIPKRISSSPLEEPYQSVHPASDQALSASSSGSEFKFQCKICDRRFASYQQLGGHQTSHRLGKSSSVRTDSSNLEGEDEYRNVDLESDGCFGGGKVFKCETCSRVFGSGQALGGHKRAHWDVKKEEIEMHIFNEISSSWIAGKNTSLWAPTARQIDASTGLLAL